MRIPDEWLNNSIYLYPSEHDAYEGTRAGGSGFLLGFDSDRIPGHQMVYAVTNAHVIEGGNCTIRLNRHDGTVDVRDLFDVRITRHIAHLHQHERTACLSEACGPAVRIPRPVFGLKS